jgi:hypothetical protein
VDPSDQTLSTVEEDVSTTVPPEQKVVGPPAVIVGTVGIALTVTIVIPEGIEAQVPSSTITEYEPEVKTVIDCVVSPVDQTLSVVEEEVNTTLSPAQKVVAPLVVIVGVVGVGLTVTISSADTPEEQPFVITSTE